MMQMRERSAGRSRPHAGGTPAVQTVQSFPGWAVAQKPRLGAKLLQMRRVLAAADRVRPMMKKHPPAPRHARRYRPPGPHPDLYRHGRRADRLAAGRPDRHCTPRGDRAPGDTRDDARRFRQRGRPADPGVPVRDDDHLGAIRRIGLYRFVRPHDGRDAGRHGRAPGADGGDRRRIVGGARQRHPGHLDRALADRRGAAPRPRSPAFCDRARRLGQCRLGGHPDRQSPEHSGGRHRPARFLELPRRLRRSGAVRAGRRLWRPVAAMAPPHPRHGGAGRRDRAGGGHRACPRPQPDDQGRRRAPRPPDPLCHLAAARDRRPDHRGIAVGQPQDHQPHDDRRGRLAALAPGVVSLRADRAAQRFRDRRQGAGVPRRSPAAAE